MLSSKKQNLYFIHQKMFDMINLKSYLYNHYFEKKTIIIPYNEISHPVTNVNCNITYQRDNKNLTLPIVLRQDVKDDPYCCFSFNYTEKQWFLCSVKVSE